MPVLNHQIVACSDTEATARFFAEVLGLGQPVVFGPFAVLPVSGDATFADPKGHSLEVLTRPDGSAGTEDRHPHPLAGD